MCPFLWLVHFNERTTTRFLCHKAPHIRPSKSYHVNYLILAVNVFHFAILRCFLGGIITYGKELVYEFVIGAEHSAPLEREQIP